MIDPIDGEIGISRFWMRFYALVIVGLSAYGLWSLAKDVAKILTASAQETTTTVDVIEGKDVLPDGESMVSSSPPRPLYAERVKTFEEIIAPLPLASIRIMFENAEEKAVAIKKDTDDLASKYAMLYDACRYSR